MPANVARNHFVFILIHWVLVLMSVVLDAISSDIYFLQLENYQRGCSITVWWATNCYPTAGALMKM